MAKNDVAPQEGSYKWKYMKLGGVTRVNIEDGADILHLNELDQKLWTVLSCPVKGLELDERTLEMLDTDGDGRLKVNEIVAAGQWLNEVLTDMDILICDDDSVNFNEIRDNTPEGREVLAAAQMIAGKLGRKYLAVTLSDVKEYMAIYEEKCRAEYQPAETEPYEAPFGDRSDDVAAAVNALRAKVEDWFMRCKLLRFDDAAAEVLDVQVDKIAAISGEDLTAKNDEIATYPLLRPCKEALLPASADTVNPAWQPAYRTLLGLMEKGEPFSEESKVDEAAWNGLVAQVDAYTAHKAAAATAMEEAIAAQVAEHAAAIEPVERMVRYCRYYYTLLRNYVVFSDFYAKEDFYVPTFKAGRLYIDQRCCELCLRVPDMARSVATAGKSGLYLIYCHCVAKKGDSQMDIVAALTDGDVGGLHEGKNAVFYDRQDNAYDATVTKIVDNPISVRQAFWSPYRKFGNWVTEKITKSASDKESKQFDEMTAKADTASSNLTAAPAEGAPADGKKAAPFDIAKFAGIFAAIGLAVGAIGAALGVLGGFIFSKWYNILLLLVLVVVVISGPSMLLAWLKLRKRNLGPVLNANGWAINSDVKINTTFGHTLTSMAKYPRVVAKDPLADKRTPWWATCLIWLAILAAVFVVGFKLTQHRWVWEPKPVEAPVAEVVEEPVNVIVDESLAAELAAGEASAE